MSLNKDKFESVNLYFQDEAWFGMMNHKGSYITASVVKPIVNYQHIYKTTYLYGSYSPMNGDSFVWEINGVNTEIFEAYLNEFSKHKPKEYKIVVIDNAGFQSTKNFGVPENIFLLRIPPYNPELNPCEQIWQYMKNRFKNKRFDTMENLKQWLHNTVCEMKPETIKSITANHHYLNSFIATFKI